MSLLSPLNIHGHRILPIAPPGPPFSSADQTDNKYQARRTSIPGQHNNCSNVIQNHPLQDQQCLHPPINADHIHNTYTPSIHTPNTYLSSSHLTVHTNQPNHKINTKPIIIPARVNTMMTNPCILPRSRNSLFKLPKQHFADQPVEFKSVIINAENYNLPVHFINHSDRDIVYPSTLMSEPWKKSKNQAEITYQPLLPQKQLVSTRYRNVLPTVHTAQPTGVDA